VKLVGISTCAAGAASAAIVLAGIGPSATPGASGPVGGPCDRVASKTGSDARGDGTLSRPYRTPQRLIGSLSPGQTGCLRRGLYGTRGRFTIRTSEVTLRSYPGERATLRGNLWILGDGTTVRELNLDGSCPIRNRCAVPSSVPSPLVNARSVLLLDDDITNRHTGICVSATTYRGVSPDLLIVQGNRIHDCGRLPPTNHQHGIYLVSGVGAVVADNLVYRNADRGIQLFPSVVGARIYGNTIDGNGEGVIVSNTSSVNQFTANIISNSTVAWNVEWNSLSGMANAITGNCLYATNRRPYYNRDGGVQVEERDKVLIAANQVANPGYANPGAGDYRLSSSSPCLGRGAPDQVAAP